MWPLPGGIQMEGTRPMYTYPRGEEFPVGWAKEVGLCKQLR
jgi:hypothetical protein